MYGIIGYPINRFKQTIMLVLSEFSLEQKISNRNTTNISDGILHWKSQDTTSK